MIEKLSIRNFKSVRELDLSCRRVNVFIGEPNAGKTSILEALGLGGADIGHYFFDSIRIRSITDLFWDQNPANSVCVTFDKDERLIMRQNDKWVIADSQEETFYEAYELNGDQLRLEGNAKLRMLAKYYVFAPSDAQWLEGETSLACPTGSNIAALLYANKEARLSASKFFANSGFRLMVDYSTKKLKLAKETDDILVVLPYSSGSETLRRMVFFHLAIDTNKGQVLAFDEPEAHAFPPYTKILAERIANDDRGNQFFLTTHSPYMLDSLLSKTPSADLNVVLCRMENFETKAYQLNQEQIVQLMDWSMDAFFNFDRLLPEVS